MGEDILETEDERARVNEKYVDMCLALINTIRGTKINIDKISNSITQAMDSDMLHSIEQIVHGSLDDLKLLLDRL